jgi:cephalosporin hydroxylase
MGSFAVPNDPALAGLPLFPLLELVNLAYWMRGFAPHNVLEIGSWGGATFFCMSRFATGKKVSVDIRDMRPKLHHFMFGHEWRFFQGDSQSEEMRKQVSSYCDSFDLIFIDGDHRYAGVKRDFEIYRGLLSDRVSSCYMTLIPTMLSRAAKEVRFRPKRGWN